MPSISEHSKKRFIATHLNRIIEIAVLSVCLIALHWSVILNLVKNWDPYDFPGFVVPLASIYLIWRKRPYLRKARRSPAIWGLFVIIAGGLLLFLGNAASVLLIGHISFVVTIIGLVLYIFGWEYLRILRFPLFFLFLMIPIPPIFLEPVNHRLQIIGAYFGALILSMFNVPVVLEANTLHLPKISIVVTEACTGLRYLFSTLMIAVLIAYMTQMKRSAKILYLMVALLIAVVTNILRVASAGAMANFISAKLVSGFYHKLHGWIMFLFDYGGLIGVAFLFSRIFRRTADPLVIAGDDEHEV